MGIIKTWIELQEEAGQSVGSTVRDVAEGVSSAACSLLAKYPNALPLAPLARGYVQGICQNSGNPIPSPSVPFQGGQCEGVRYRVYISYTFGASGSDETQEREEILNTVTGAILGYTDNGDTNGSVIVVNVQTTANPEGTNYVKNLGFGSELVPDTLVVTFPAVNPEEDVCGDPPSQLPPDPPIDPADFTKSITVNTYNDGGDVVTTNNYGVDFNGVDFNQFDFALSVGGLDVNVDVGGVNIGGGSPGEGGKIDRLIEDTGKKCTGGGGFVPEELEEEELEEEELVVEEEEGLAWVTADITTPPRSSTTILHSNALDADYFAGYVVFTVSTDNGVYQLPPQSVKKVRSIFKAPDGATGFRAYPVNGAQLRITAYYEKEEE